MGQPTTTLDQLESVFGALSDRTRLRILALIGNNEVCVCHLHDSLGVPQPTASRHLAYLRRAGLVTARRDGVWMHYSLSASLPPHVRDVLDASLRALARVSTTTKDRAQFSRQFGTLYVEPAESGGTCCVPKRSS